MGLGQYLSAMKAELSPKQILAVPCPTCGVAAGEKCELTTGQPRFESHRDRRLIAAELSQDPRLVATQCFKTATRKRLRTCKPDSTPAEVCNTGDELRALFQAKLAVVLLDNPIAFTGGIFKFLAVHDLHRSTGPSLPGSRPGK